MLACALPLWRLPHPLENLAESALLALITAPAVGIALVISRPRRIGPAALFLGLFILNGFLVGAPVVYDVAQVPGANWNWTGKFLGLAWTLAFIALGPLSWREVGLTLRQRPGSTLPAALVTFVLFALGAAIGAVFGSGGPFRAETVAYQLTMPGLAEELVYRGLFLALLHRAVPSDSESAAFWWPAAITTLAFALTHSPNLDGGRVMFDFLPFLYPLIVGAAFAWLRERTGSLTWPVVAHNVSNTAIFVVGALR